MHFPYRLPLVLIATAAVLVGTCRGADDDDEDEDDFGGFGFLAASPRSLNVSMKVTQGAQVRFGNLGSVPNNFDHSQGAQLGRSYDDGDVAMDYYRPASGNAYDELTAGPDGRPIPKYPNTPRYQVTNPSGGLIGDFLSYNPERTRSWRYRNESQSQEQAGYIAFHNYSAQSQGGGFTSSKNLNGGFEIGVSHAITNPTKRISFSLTATLGLSGVYAYKAGKVSSTLVTYTDLYRFFPYSGTDAPFDTPPTGGTLDYRYSAPGNLLPATGNTSVIENTTALSQNPDIHLSDTYDEDEAEVEGQWRLKGAYFTLKVGPQINAMLTRSIGLNAGVGFAGTYASTRYSAFESFKVEGLDDEIAMEAPVASTKSILLAGYYANIDATWSLNDRTGIFAGFSYEQLGEYNQKLEGRTAKIDLSATAGIRGGMTIKF